MPRVVAKRPLRLNISNLQTGEGFYVQFNPTQLKRSVQSAWQSHEVLGQSYRPLDYLGTDNAKVDFSVYLRAENAAQQAGLEEVAAFLESLQYPPDTGDSIVGRRPPRCLIVWPGSLVFTAVMRGFDMTHEMFDAQGRTIQATIKLNWEEARRSRLTQEDVRERGPFRSPEQAGGD